MNGYETESAARLGRGFYDRAAMEVAPQLIGKLLVHRLSKHDLRVGRIVETEAYDGPDDKANHASKGKTARNEVMFERAGLVYVYLVYGMHHCLNLVTGPAGYPAAVLIRALEPVSGLERSTKGPGRLCRAMGIDRSHNRRDATSGDLFAAEDGFTVSPGDIISSARIGVHYAGAWAQRNMRFHLRGNPWVSKRPAGRYAQSRSSSVR